MSGIVLGIIRAGTVGAGDQVQILVLFSESVS